MPVQDKTVDSSNRSNTNLAESNWNDVEEPNENSHLQGKQWLHRPTVEPVVFLFLAASSLSSTVTQTLYLQRVCEQDLKLNESQCSELNVTERTSEQPHATNLLMTKSLLEALLPAALTLFLGPWSDRHGRKPLLFVPLLGHATTYALYAWLSSLNGLPGRYLIAASVPIALTGGFIALVLSSFSYIADVSSIEKRGLRLSLVDVSVSLSSILGNAASAPLFHAYGYTGIYTTAAVLCLVAFFYVLFLLPESVHPPSQDSEGVDTICKFLQQTIVEVFNVSFKWRPNHKRAIVLLCAVALAFFVVTLTGEGGIMFLYTNKKFGWVIENYTRFSIAALSMSVFGTFGTLYLFVNVLHFSEPLVAAFGFICRIVSSLLAAFSPKAWYLYIASASTAVGGMAVPLVRSTMSKSVPPNEVGSVFSLTAALESVTPLIASPLYTAVYNATIVSFPGAIFIMSSAFFSVNVALLLVVACLQFRSSNSATYFHLPPEPGNEEYSGAIES